MAYKSEKQLGKDVVLAGEVIANSGESVGSLFNRMHPILTSLYNDNPNRFIKGSLVVTGASGNKFISPVSLIGMGGQFIFCVHNITINSTYGPIVTTYNYAINRTNSLYVAADEYQQIQNIVNRSTDQTVAKVEFYW